MTRLCAGSFSEVIAGTAAGSALAFLLLVDQMPMSIAPNDEDGGVESAVNSLRMSRSRSMQGDRSHWSPI
jgi:hypothetical protein